MPGTLLFLTEAARRAGRCTGLGLITLLFAFAILTITRAGAQTTPAVPPSGQSPTQTAPLPPPVAAPAPTDMDKPSADASTGQMVDLQPRPVLRLRGQSTWDDGFTELKKAIGLLNAEAQRLGLAGAGLPFAHFVESDDLGFTYEAMLPLAAAPPVGFGTGPGIEATTSPAGRAITFTHEGSYEEIDAAYEAITAFLDEKGLTATGKFLEEYLLLPEKSDDPGMKITITIFLK